MRRTKEEKKPIPKASGSTKGGSDPKIKSLEKAYGGPTKKQTITKGPVKQSSIVAASKASHAEKYGTAGPSKPSVKPPTETSSKPAVSETPKVRKVKANPSSTTGPSSYNPSGGSKTSAPPPKNVPPGPSLSEKPKPVPPVSEDNYDDDFEEDYPSDFEDDDIVAEEPDEDEAKNPVEEEVIARVPSQEVEVDTTPQNQKESSSSEDEHEIPLQQSNVVKGATQSGASVASGFFKVQGAKTIEESIVPAKPNNGPESKKPSVSQKQNTNDFKVTTNQKQKTAIMPTRGFDFEAANINVQKENKLRRSLQLKDMIMLHEIAAITVLHSDSSNEQFMYAMSRTRRVDKPTQVDKPSQAQEVQTDDRLLVNKWTQQPPSWSVANAKPQIKTLREEAMGVGSEAVGGGEIQDKERSEDLLQWELEIGSNWSKIAKFITRASKKVLYALESQNRISLNKETKGGSSSGEITLSRGLKVFNNLEMDCLVCSGDYLACANFYPATKSIRKHEAKSIISLWSLKEPSCPKYFLRMWGKVTAIALHLIGHIVVAGGQDGGLAFWDLDESVDYHKEFEDQIIRTATIDTALLAESHRDRVIGIEVVQESDDSSVVMSIDFSGTLKYWGLYKSKQFIQQPENPKHTAYWSKLNLSIRHTFNLAEVLSEPHLRVTCFKSYLSFTEKTCWIFGTVNGFVVHGVPKKIEESSKNAKEDTGTNASEKVVESANNRMSALQIVEPPIQHGNLTLRRLCQEDKKSWIVSVDVCSKWNMCVAGSVDGKCRIYSLLTPVVLFTVEPGGDILRVLVSQRRKSAFYVVLENVVHIYDVLKNKDGNGKPWRTVSLKDIRDLQICTTSWNEFTIILASSNDLKVSMVGGNLHALTDEEWKKFRIYIENQDSLSKD